MTIADLGEFGLIAALAAGLPRGDRTVVGIGDDAAVLTTPDRRVVATTDLLLEGLHFRRDRHVISRGRQAASGGCGKARNRFHANHVVEPGLGNRLLG